MKTINTIILCFLTVLLAQCKKDKPYVPVKTCSDLTGNMDTVLLYLPGTWNWLQEKRYDRVDQEYKYLTPKTEGYTSVLKINGDTAEFYKNGNPSEIYKFKILKESDITNIATDTDTVFAFYNFSTGVIQNYVPIKICSTYLVLQAQFTTSVSGEQTWKRM